MKRIVAIAALAFLSGPVTDASAAGRDEEVPAVVVDQETAQGLKRLQPGDTITLSMRDASTGQHQAITAVVNGRLTAPATTSSSSPSRTTTTIVSTPVERRVVTQYMGTPVQLVGVDPNTRQVVVVDEKGSRRSLPVDANTVLRMSSVEPGQKVFLSYRYAANGQAEALVRPATERSIYSYGAVPATPTTITVPAAENFRDGLTAEVLACDPVMRNITVRTPSGHTRIFAVDDRAAVELGGLRSGENVFLVVDGERVLAVRRR